MSETLVIELTPDLGGLARAGTVAEDGRWLGDLGAESLSGRSAIVVVPGEWVASHSLMLPAFAPQKLVKILPGVLDERISRAGADRHFAVLAAGAADRPATVAVMDRAVMDRIMILLAGLGISATLLVPDYMLLPQPDEGVNAARYHGRVLARFADGSGFAAEADLADTMLAGSQTAPEKISSPVLLPAACGTEATLLQGAFAPRGDVAAMLVWFRRSGVLALLAFALWLATGFYAAYDNNRRADATYAAAEAVFRKALPDVPRIVNMQAQMRRAVAGYAQEGGGEFFALSDRVFRAVEASDQTLVESLRYDQTTGDMVLNMSFASYAEGDSFRRALQEGGLLVREGSSRQDGARVFSELTVRRAG
ncbi:MAG: hypothetical protein EP335_03950 [Alphaproteobacteria bacterium]|nr:MAG: hypothetical protein EP335_03950 [Alphaproteobacteria bacterium]